MSPSGMVENGVPPRLRLFWFCFSCGSWVRTLKKEMSGFVFTLLSLFVTIIVVVCGICVSHSNGVT